ncbi:MAG: efflux RND transporter permease subunit, partial [Nannocystaceae bacterium]|nr:efflux RND transporter permease subunit [Nannocystaceae bacterium]
MKSALEALLRQHRLVLLSAFVLSLLGAVAWSTMPRQEDPELTGRWGTVAVSFSGADAEAVERLIAKPIEEALEEVEEIRFVRTATREGFAFLSIILRESVGPAEIDEVWKEIEDAIDRAKQELPRDASEPFLDKGLVDLEAVVLAITGAEDPLVLHHAAHELRDQLLTVDGVARVKIIADPGEEIIISYDDAVAQRVGLSRAALTAQLQARNQMMPGGSVRAGDRHASLSPVTELEDIADIERMPVVLPGGTTVPLSSVAEVSHGPIDPRRELMRWQGVRAVGLGVVFETNANVVVLGDRLREKLVQARETFAPLKIEEVTFLPDRVESRISGLGRSLLVSTLIVGGILVLSMGLRLGLVVTAIVPLVAMSALAIFAMGGGILHQMSVAALVIALGMLVDNAIVVAENVQRRLDDGESPQDAARRAVGDLALPLLTATGTTVAAFVPMLLAEGGVGEFTRAIPILVTLVLLISFLYAALVTPVVSRWVLRAMPRQRETAWDSVGRRIGHLAVRRAPLVLVLVFAALAAVGSQGGRVQKNFFPGADRNQVIVDLRLPEGAHLDAIDDAARTIETALSEHPNVVSVAAFVGRSAPHFYYNVLHLPNAPHVAQLLVTTTGKPDNGTVETFVRELARAELPGLQVVAAQLEQGPGLAAPVEIRAHGNDLAKLDEAASIIAAELARIEGTRDIRDTLSVGIPQVRLEVDDAAAARHGVTRRDVASAVLGHTYGHVVGALRTGDDPVEIRVRAPAGENTPVESVGDIVVLDAAGHSIPVAEIARTDAVWRPASYIRRDGRRVVYVRANLEAGYAYSTVIDTFVERLPDLKIPEGIEISLGGAAEGAGDANSAMFSALPLGLLMLVGFLMVEFNSFRRVLIVLSTVPMAAVGVIPGLILADQPFGFMSLLGVIALAGVVVNNAIVLLDVIEMRRREGMAIPQAVADAVRLRLRPIVLTTVTTVAGLIPLAISGSSLWPPLAWSMISGLLASTALTLVMVP